MSAIPEIPGLCAKAIERFGSAMQIRQTAEECSELAAECLRVLRGRTDHLDAMFDEAADVYIMVHQIMHMDFTRFTLALERKAEHLRDLVQEVRQ